MDRTETPIWRGVEAAAALLVLGFFLYALRGILNPLLLFVLLWTVLLPFRGRPGHGALLAVTGVLTLLWLLATTGSLLAPFVLSVVLAYLLDPVVDRLRARRIPRALGIVLLTIPVLAALAALVVFGIPAAAHQLADIVERAPVFFDRLVAWAEGARARLLVVDLPLVDEDALLERLRGVDSEAVVAFVQERRDALGSWAWKSVLGVGRGVGFVAGLAGYFVLTPVLTFYLLRDWDRLRAAVADLLPASRRDAIMDFAREYDVVLGRYMRGQLTVAVALGVITFLGLALLRFPHAATLGLLVAVFSVIPYLGLLLSLVPAVFIAIVSGSVWVSLLKVAVVYTMAQTLEAAVISPRIVGDSVGLHPVWVVLALALGGYYFGFVGLLIAVPAAAGIKLLVIRGLARYRASELYRGSPAA
jgi:predicted PurR-regulated permease PerM